MNSHKKELHIINQEKDIELVNTALDNFTTLRIKNRLSETMEIPPLSDTARQVLLLKSDENAGVADLAAIISKDAPLTSQIISWASSAYYAAPGGVSSLQDAIMRVLGFDLVLNIAFGLSSAGSLKSTNQKDYWFKSILTATMAERLAKVSHKQLDSGTSYLCGLLHNFGQLILSHVFPPYFESIQATKAEMPDIDNSILEEKLLNINGEQIASLLLREWNLPEEVIVGIRFQKDANYNKEFCEYSSLLFVCYNSLKEAGLLTGDYSDYTKQLNTIEVSRESLDKAISYISSSVGDLKAMSDTMLT